MRASEHKAELTKLRWGLVPFWAGGKPLKEIKLTASNAKAEAVATAVLFPGLSRPAPVPGGGDRWCAWTVLKGLKQGWLFTSRSGEPLTFGGVWDRCKTSDGGELQSFAIVTQPARAPLNGYHDRAPVVIWPADQTRWHTAGTEVADLIGPESADAFPFRPDFQGRGSGLGGRGLMHEWECG